MRLFRRLLTDLKLNHPNDRRSSWKFILGMVWMWIVCKSVRVTNQATMHTLFVLTGLIITTTLAWYFVVVDLPPTLSVFNKLPICVCLSVMFCWSAVYLRFPMIRSSLFFKFFAGLLPDLGWPVVMITRV